MVLRQGVKNKITPFLPVGTVWGYMMEWEGVIVVYLIATTIVI